MKKLNVGILIFDDVEVLDFAGPYEVFSRTRTIPGVAARQSEDSSPFNVFTVARDKTQIKAIGGLNIIPDYSFVNVPTIDILVVPGGFGTRKLLEDNDVLEWIKSRAQKSLTTSVCTGALLLAKIGLLKNRRATTHFAAFDLLAKIDDSIKIVRDVRFVDDGVITSAGVAAGIEMVFYLVEKLCGKEIADETARYIEYPRATSP